MHFLISLFLVFFNVLHESSTLCHFMNLDLKKQAQALEVNIFRENKIISLTNLFEQDVKNFSEREIKFLSSYHTEKCSNAYKIRKSVSLD